MILIILFLILIMSIYYNNFIKFMIMFELVMIMLYLNFNMLLKMMTMNFTLNFISLIIIESSLAILLLFEMINSNKFIFPSNLFLF